MASTTPDDGGHTQFCQLLALATPVHFPRASGRAAALARIRAHLETTAPHLLPDLDRL